MIEYRRAGRDMAKKTIELRQRCHEILEEIEPATVRAVCYRLFVQKLIPDMSKNSTGKVSRILTGAREDGEIPRASQREGSPLSVVCRPSG
jgi:hypothetical protein